MSHKNYRKSYLDKRRRKRKIEIILTIIMIAVIVWIFLSYTNVIFQNLSEGSHNYPFWNFFELLF